MRTRRLLGVLGLAGAAALVLSAIPITRPVLSLRPSGDPSDREDIAAGRTALQRVTLAAGVTLTRLELLLREPWPRDAELVIALAQHDEKREARAVLSTATDNRVRVDFDTVQVEPNDPVEIRITARGTPTTVPLATATGVPADFAGSLTIGAHGRDRHLALTFFEKTTVGAIARERIAARLAPGAPLFGRAAVGAALGVALAAFLRTTLPDRRFVLTLLALAVLFLALHEPFRRGYPATNDEGSILLDAQLLRAGEWPGGAKGPLAVALLSGMVSVTGPSLLAARGFVAVLGAVAVVLIGVLGRRLWGARGGVIAAALAATLPAVHAQSAQVFLQSFSLPFVLAALVVLLHPARNVALHAALAGQPALLRPPDRLTTVSAAGRAMLAGALLALAALARQTSLAFLPIALALTAADVRNDLRSVVRRSLMFLSGFALTVLLATALAFSVLGKEKTLDVLGWQGVVVAQQRGSAPTARTQEGTAESPLRMTVRNGWPVILGGAPLFILSVAFLLKAAGDLLRVPLAAVMVVSAAALAILVAAGRTVLAVPEVPMFAPLALGLVLFTVAGALLLLPRLSRITRPGRDLLLLAGSWITLMVGYAQYGRFRLHYHAEFLPLYILAGAALLGMLTVSRKERSPSAPRWILALPLAGIGAFIALAYPVVLARHHAGNIPLPVVAEVVDDLRHRTAQGEEVFTAQVLFPVLADRPVPFGISHPGWYREEMFGTVPTELRRRYYPDRDVLRVYLRERPVRVAVIERRTREVFLEFDPQLKELLQSQYERVRVVENPLLDPIEIWQWKK